MASATSAPVESGGKSPLLSGPAWLFPKILAWFGASTGALTAICTVFGYLVEHAYLAQLGVSRTIYESTSREYVVTGALFLVGLVPSSVLGGVSFAIHYWWIVLLAVALSIASWRWRLSSRLRFML